MARSIVVKNTVIGEGMPCICVPLTQTDAPGLEAEAEQAAAVCPDLVEWRADCFENIFSPLHVEGVLKRLYSSFETCGRYKNPLFCGYRSDADGIFPAAGSGGLASQERDTGDWVQPSF